MWKDSAGRKTPVGRSVDDHITNRRLELGRSILQRTRVYLDTRYWLLLRDVSMGRRNDQPLRELHELLLQASSTKRLVCPIEGASFFELLGQSDLGTRRVTARLMDQLSGGVSLAPPQERRQTEMFCFIRQWMDSASAQLSPSLRVWTKVGHLLGDLLPHHEFLTPEQNAEIQLGFYDYMWERTIEFAVNQLADARVPSMQNEKLAGLLNQGKDKYAHEMKSHKYTYLSEVRGILEDCEQYLDALLAREFEHTTGQSAPPLEQRDPHDIKVLVRLMREGLRKGLCAHQLPFVHIPASLHAAIRWDRKRRLQPNDFPDIQHADAALPYCDVFLTERPLRTLIQSLGLDGLYRTTVVSEICEAPDAIRDALERPRATDETLS